MAIAFGIKIITQDYEFSPAPSSDWGLYSFDATHSEFRWIQNNISGLSPEWKSGIIIEQGISNFTVEIDLRSGGTSNLPGSGSVSIKNSGNFKEFLESKLINLNGLRLEIWELGTGNYQNRIRTYFCFEPEYDNKVFKIPFGGGNENRSANIINVVTSIQFPYASNDTLNKAVPATFGKLIPIVDEDLQRVARNSIAKFVRTNDLESYRKYTDAFFADGGHEDTYMFPLDNIYHTSTRYYVFYLRTQVPPGGSGWIETPVDTYLKIVDGVGKNQIRQLDRIEWFEGETLFYTQIKDYFETELQDDDTDNARSWGQLIEVKRRYDCDHFPIQGFYTSEDEELVTGAEIYTADSDEKLQRVAPYGYDIDKTDDANNKLDIDPLLFESGNLNTQDSFLVLPVESLSAADTENLIDWSDTVEAWWAFSTKHPTYDGLYTDGAGNFPDIISNVGMRINLENITDKNSLSYGQSYLDGQQNSGGFGYHKVYLFDLPKLPPGFSFDKCYIGIKLHSECSVAYSTESSIRLFMRRFKFGIKRFGLTGVGVGAEGSGGVTVDDMPDFYFDDLPITHNEHFLKTVDEAHLQTGYNNTYFDTGITSKEEYETYIQGGIFLGRIGVVTVDPIIWSDDTKYYELCFIFKKSSDITKEIYSPVHGRVFSYTWDGRKTETDLIEKPADLLEHVCRLQSYIDQGVPPVSGWGLQYADIPQIGTSGYGSFDDPDLVSQRDYKAAAQIYEYEKGYTDDLKNKICKDFVMANWQDEDGYERVIALPENKIEPVYTIQMSDVLDRTKIKVSQLPDDKIITEPYIKYGLNPVTGEYENAMKISNASASAYNSKYVDGIHDSAEAAALWRSCHSLYLTTHSITKPSKDQTELTWANGSGGYTIALNYLKNLINWQFGYEIELPIHYNLCSSWNQCTPVNMLFSHQTDNISKSALIEKIEVNPNPGYGCTIQAIIYK